MSERGPQHVVVEACEGFFARHGDSHLGVGWTKTEEEATRRYEVMLGLIEARPESEGPTTLLDLGCGLSHLYEHMERTGRQWIEYSGCDLSDVFLAQSRAKHPHVRYHQVDILEAPDALPVVDYVVMNGLLTLRGEVPRDVMYDYARALVTAAFGKARRGIAFNVMSKQVDWERDDLFHVPFDDLATFLVQEVSRHFTFRHDYGLYEYTTYVFHEPRTTA